MIEKFEVFTSGRDGYHTYRIPAVLVSAEGMLLAFCEGRRNNQRDHGDIDLLLKRSEDGGRSWSEQQVVYGEAGEVTIGNPCPVVDRETGAIHLTFCRDNTDVLVTRSDDNGATWSAPEEITANVKREAWGWYATGPGVGVQLAQGNQKGRLVIPCDHREDATYHNGSHAIYSDDHGKTWKLSAAIKPGANECQVVELDGGRLLMNMRMQEQRKGCRGIAFSEDGGETWSSPAYDEQLPCPTCQASFIRYTLASDGGKNRLLFSNPIPPAPGASGREARIDMTVRLSYDEGKTWPVKRLIQTGPSAYSCLTALPDGDVGCLYECGSESPYEHLIFARFSLEWLTNGKDRMER